MEQHPDIPVSIQWREKRPHVRRQYPEQRHSPQYINKLDSLRKTYRANAWCFRGHGHLRPRHHDTPDPSPVNSPFTSTFRTPSSPPPRPAHPPLHPSTSQQNPDLQAGPSPYHPSSHTLAPSPTAPTAAIRSPAPTRDDP